MIGFITVDEQIVNINKAKPKSIPELYYEYDFITAEEELKKYKISLMFLW